MSTPIKTCGDFRFGAAASGQKLFSIVDGLDAIGALQVASNLLDMVNEALLDVGMGESLSSNNAFLLHHAVESAKAAVDAAQCGLECTTKQGVRL